MEIATERCVMRAYAAADRDAFIGLNTDPEVRRHMNGPLSPEQADQLFREILSRGNPGRFSWAVTERSTGDFIGHVFLTGKEEAGREFGFMLDRDYWGRGIGTEIVAAAAVHIRHVLKIKRVFATADIAHTASHRVLEKAGFRHDGDESDEHGPYRIYRQD